jgi:hypothetical protein
MRLPDSGGTDASRQCVGNRLPADLSRGDA